MTQKNNSNNTENYRMYKTLELNAKEILEKEFLKSIQDFEKELTEKYEDLNKEDIKLLRVIVLDFKLPSEALAVLKYNIEVDLDKNLIKEIREIERNIKRKIDNLRKQFYNECERIFHSSLLGWVTLSKEGIEFVKKWDNRIKYELKEILKLIDKLSVNTKDEKYKLYYNILKAKIENKLKESCVDYIVVYLDSENAKKLLSSITSELNEEIVKLREEISKLEKEKRDRNDTIRLSNLRRKLNYLTLKYFMFKEALNNL